MSRRAPDIWFRSAPGGAVVWKIMFTGSGLVVTENRRQGERLATFSCFDGGTGEEVLGDFLPGEATPGDDFGMTGLETVGETLFYVHAYRPDSPEHIGLWALDPSSAAVVWARADTAFVAHVPGGMLVYRPRSFAGFPERYYMILDELTGEVIDEPGSDVRRVEALRARTVAEEERQNVILPETVRDEAAPSGNLRESIRKGELLVTVEHRPASGGNGFDAVLEARRGGALFHSDRLASGSDFPCMNYFLLHGVRVYYIRNMTELVSFGA